MQRLAIHLLLLASLAPAILAAAPVYHCRMTGIDTFRCGCCRAEATGGAGAATEVRSCCSRHRETPPNEDSPAGPRFSSPAAPAVCACCEIVTGRFATVVPREDRAAALALRLAPAPHGALASGAALPAAPEERAGPGSRAFLPAPRSPLPAFHAPLRC